MSTFYPYKIHHLALDKDLHKIHKDWTVLCKQYCVFWWKQVPLGHFYLDENKRDKSHPSIIDGLQLVFETLLQKYSAAIEIEELKKIIGNADQQRLNQILEALFDGIVPDSMPVTVEVSIVICTRNRSTELKECLETLGNSHVKPSEIIIVDNAPDDDLTERVTKTFQNVIYLKEERKGLDIARNSGAKRARFPVIAYIDDDVVVDANWLYRIYNSFQDPKIDAVTGLVLPLQLQTESQYIFERFWSFNKGYLEKIYSNDFLKSHSKGCPEVWTIGAGANMAFRKSVLEKVGYFDERLDAGAAGCSGDSEIWFRILLSGGKIVYNPLAVVHHNHRSDMNGLKQQLHNYMKGNVVAALIQHNLAPHLNYNYQAYTGMWKNYLFHILRKFKNPTLRHKTVIPEALGALSGIVYYWKHRSDNKL